MKRYIILSLILLMTICMPLAPAEEALPEAEPPMPETAAEAAATPLGDWYGTWNSVPLQFTFREDGTYTLACIGQPDSARDGQWKLDDGFIYLDGDETAPLSFDDDRLSLRSAGLFLYREQAEFYTPGNVNPGAVPEDFAGAWRAARRVVKGVAVSADRAQENTRIYIEQTRAATVGRRFGQQILDFTFENGALTCETDGKAVRIEMQEDYMLRMTITEGEQDTVLIFAPFLTDGLFPEETPAE